VVVVSSGVWLARVSVTVSPTPTPSRVATDLVSAIPSENAGTLPSTTVGLNPLASSAGSITATCNESLVDPVPVDPVLVDPVGSTFPTAIDTGMTSASGTCSRACTAAAGIAEPPPSRMKSASD